MNPHICIITINLNNIGGLRRTVQSVREQDYPDLSHVIIDGDSTDGSAEYVRSLEDETTRVVIERDSGIYNAYNKGRSLAQGDFVLYLNSGDYLVQQDTLSGIARWMDDSNLLYFGRKLTIDADHRVRAVSPDREFLPEGGRTTRVPHTSTCFFPLPFIRANAFDESFRISGDKEYKHRAMQTHPVFFVPLDVTCFDDSGVSSAGHSSVRSLLSHFGEKVRIRRKYGSLPSTMKYLLRFGPGLLPEAVRIIWKNFRNNSVGHRVPRKRP